MIEQSIFLQLEVQILCAFSGNPVKNWTVVVIYTLLEHPAQYKGALVNLCSSKCTTHAAVGD
jgi:hypothetical protein